MTRANVHVQSEKKQTIQLCFYCKDMYSHPGLHSPAVAWPPRPSAGRRESGSQGPWLGEAAPQPEGNSVCAQQAPARLGFPGALPSVESWGCGLGPSPVRLGQGEHSPSAGEPVREQRAPGKCSVPRPGSPVPSTPERREGLRAEWTGWISLQSKGLSRVFSNITVQQHQFFSSQLSSQSNFRIHT